MEDKIRAIKIRKTGNTGRKWESTNVMRGEVERSWHSAEVKGMVRGRWDGGAVM